jgi:uncharacterized membrane protein YpjA
MSLSWFLSRAFLMDRRLLWLLFIFNGLGTAYGYVWYGGQLRWTVEHHPLWRIVFVPDSPTASLFFTIWLLLVLIAPARESGAYRVFRIAVEALAVLTLVKYGVWAVVMNAAQGLQGDPLDWQNWMLIASHAAMAVEGLLYARFMRFGKVAALLAFGWMMLNDAMDYGVGIYPWLPSVLEDDLPAIAWFTYSLSVASYLATLIVLRFRPRGGADPA